MDSYEVPFERRGEPWFDDGNIILLPESESKVGFKVHRGVLSRHSEVFRSMFDIPQPGIVHLIFTLSSALIVRSFYKP